MLALVHHRVEDIKKGSSCQKWDSSISFYLWSCNDVTSEVAELKIKMIEIGTKDMSSSL
jgi:hypothetical protein